MLSDNCKECNKELLIFEDKERGICMPCLWKEVPLLSDEERNSITNLTNVSPDYHDKYYN